MQEPIAVATAFIAHPKVKWIAAIIPVQPDCNAHRTVNHNSVFVKQIVSHKLIRMIQKRGHPSNAAITTVPEIRHVLAKRPVSASLLIAIRVSDGGAKFDIPVQANGFARMLATPERFTYSRNDIGFFRKAEGTKEGFENA
jgi:hypothetical protein